MRPQVRNAQGLRRMAVERGRAGALPSAGLPRGWHVCEAACARKRAFLWEVRAEGVWSAWQRGSLWAPMSGRPGVSGCVPWGVAGLHEAGGNSGPKGEVAFQLWEGEFNVSERCFQEEPVCFLGIP